MILRLIADVNKALEAESYFSALSLVLTLPDICGKAEYPQEKSTAKRYKDWYDEYIGKYEQCPCEQSQNTEMPYLSGEVVYSLRNSLLHQGTPNIDPLKIKNDNNKIDCFEIIIESKKPFDIYSDASGIINGSVRTYRVNIRRLCLILCNSVKSYYEESKDKFNFFKFTIIDLDNEVERMKNLKLY